MTIKPRIFRILAENVKRPFDHAFRFGCYFPGTDLCVNDMGHRSTGKPDDGDVQWLEGDEIEVGTKVEGDNAAT